MLYDIFCILWDIVLLLLLLIVAGALTYVAFMLSTFVWPAALFLAVVAVIWILVR